jgi:hypothetical protein
MPDQDKACGLIANEYLLEAGCRIKTKLEIVQKDINV